MVLPVLDVLVPIDVSEVREFNISLPFLDARTHRPYSANAVEPDVGECIVEEPIAQLRFQPHQVHRVYGRADPGHDVFHPRVARASIPGCVLGDQRLSSDRYDSGASSVAGGPWYVRATIVGRKVE